MSTYPWPSDTTVVVVGAGFAGVEAAWAVADAGLTVTLVEMRPDTMTPAHRTGNLAEIVCSNSFKSDTPGTASRMLKDEMRILGSVSLLAASESSVPAGGALAVDRNAFSQAVTRLIAEKPNIRVIRAEVTEIPLVVPTIIATGPLTSEALGSAIVALTGEEHLYFHDAIAPTIDADSINRDIVFHASRYGKGEGGYLNCPMTEDEYEAFIDALMSADRVPLKDFEDVRVFEGCMPVEEIADRGRLTLAHGPMKPVGLTDPRTGMMPFAVVQLRQENLDATLYGMVGFQTRLKWGDQKRVFRMIPGLENAEFARFGAMHRNTFINSPRLLNSVLRYVGPGRDSNSAPQPPRQLQATAGDGCVTLSWEASATAGVVAYRLQRSTAPKSEQMQRVYVSADAPKLRRWDYVVLQKRFDRFDMKYVNPRVR
ncbi:MAG: methylenetetrahydrofolate--tRNA-(uracil(54)-C(5))-methyltransferase (FADH(2)-oxidizing) TrmFO, partial [Armatimonadetes bacterium]|nr:methylenetetrahydrofolate--tRNA-(uracil(54)-C(5))-methyltransferase (FADH(2)-oxidizing) TrmFO [Armatimonadota bacterium]